MHKKKHNSHHKVTTCGPILH